MARQHVHIGVFLPSPSTTQLLDTASVDIFGMMSHQYHQDLSLLPSYLTDLAPDITISYIGPATTTTTQKQQTPDGTAANMLKLSSNMTIQLTHKTTDPAVAPGNLDIVLIPGPDPRETFHEQDLAWLRRQAESPGTDILSVCTGIFVCGAAGLLDSSSSSSNPPGGGQEEGEGKTRRKACGPREMQAQLARAYPSCDLVGGELRWVRDGNFWSSGAVTNGNDLVAAYCRGDGGGGGRFPGPLVELVLRSADVGDRPQRYGEGKGEVGLDMAW